jgi:DNA (cytosine-5)-methyltransferase 1
LIVKPNLLNAAHFGVPQNRERVFIIGFKKDDLTNEAIQKLSHDIIDKAFNPYPSSISDLSKINSGLVLSDLEEPEFTEDISQKYYSKAKFLNNKSQGQVE